MSAPRFSCLTILFAVGIVFVVMASIFGYEAWYDYNLKWPK
jgi:hypothetical protein